MAPGQVLLTVEEGAARLALSRSKVYQLLAAGELGSVRLGPRILRIPVAALDAWIERQAGESRPVEVARG